MKSSDRQLIRNIRKGDAKSFEELFDRYYDRFYAFACALLHDRDAAEDILQNVFLKLWIGRERLDEDRSVSNYLLVSVRNEIYDWLSLKYNSAIVRCSAPPESEDYSADIEESMAVLETSGRLDRINASPASEGIYDVTLQGNVIQGNIRGPRHFRPYGRTPYPPCPQGPQEPPLLTSLRTRPAIIGIVARKLKMTCRFRFH